jgi:hypothetical protein
MEKERKHFYALRSPQESSIPFKIAMHKKVLLDFVVFKAHSDLTPARSQQGQPANVKAHKLCTSEEVFLKAHTFHEEV